MACCGAKRARQNSKSRAPIPNALPGADGLVKLEFLGKEKFMQRSAKTGVYYEFGPDRRLSYVDKSDAAMLLEFSENGDKLFKKLSALDVPLPPPEISSVVKGIGAEMAKKRARKA